MKKLVVLLSALTILFVTPVVVANEESNENNQDTKVTTLPAGKVVNKDYFAFGDTVEISGTVNGDVYTAAGQVLVDGKINGDLLVAGGVVSISGSVSQDVRVGGGQVTVSGKIGRNLTVGGGSVEVTEGAKIGGSLLAGAGNITLSAPVNGDVKVGAGSIIISSKVGGDIEAAVDIIRLTSKARVGGKLTYWSSRDASIDENAIVVGKVEKKTPLGITKPSAPKIFGIFTGFSLITALISLISTFILGLILIRFFPRYNTSLAATLSKKPWVSLGVGFLVLILTPIVFVLLMVSVVGLPLGLILMALYFVSLYAARVFVIIWVGTTILDRSGGKGHEVWALIVGLIVYYIVTLIPVIGSLVVFLTILIGFGASILAKKDLYFEARSKNIL